MKAFQWLIVALVAVAALIPAPAQADVEETPVCKPGEVLVNGRCLMPACPPGEYLEPTLGYCLPLNPPNCSPGQPCDFTPTQFRLAPQKKGMSCRAVRVEIEPACTEGKGCSLDQAQVVSMLMTVVLSCSK